MSQDGEEIVEDVTATNHVTIEGLMPCSTYEILVKALNDHDNMAGLYSPKANGTTSPASKNHVKPVLRVEAHLNKYNNMLKDLCKRNEK